MPSGVASIPRYQKGGPHPPPERSGIQTLFGGQFTNFPEPDQSGWGGLGAGEVPTPQLLDDLGLSAEEFARQRAQEHLDRKIIEEFNLTRPIRDVMAETPRRPRGWPRGTETWTTGEIIPSGEFEEALWMQDVRDEFAQRYPDAPKLGPLPQDRYTQSGVPIKPRGSWESYLPSRYPASARIEEILSGIMRSDLTPEELALVVDDPILGGTLSPNAPDTELVERAHARRYADRRLGASGSAERRRFVEDLVEELLPKDPDQRWNQTLHDQRTSLRRVLNDLPGASRPWADPAAITSPRSGLGRFVSKASTAAKGAGLAGLRWAANKLPAIIATTGAVGTGLGTAIDLAASPTELGSGDLPEPPRFTDEEMEIIRDKQREEFQLLEDLGLTPPFPSTQPWASPQGSSIRSRGFGRASGGIIPLRSHHRAA